MNDLWFSNVWQSSFFLFYFLHSFFCSYSILIPHFTIHSISCIFWLWQISKHSNIHFLTHHFFLELFYLLFSPAENTLNERFRPKLFSELIFYEHIWFTWPQSVLFIQDICESFLFVCVSRWCFVWFPVLDLAAAFCVTF